MRVLVVAGVLIEGNRVLLTRRPAGTHLEHCWEFPGGKVEEGEAPEVALRRELLEELGLACVVGDILEVTWWQYPSKEVLLLFYRAQREAAGVIQHLGVADHAWVALEELGNYQFPPADEPVLEKVRRLLRS